MFAEACVEQLRCLARQAAGDVDGSVRGLAAAALLDDPARAGAGETLLRGRLRDAANATVRRAAAALGVVGGPDAVPDLIRSLVTTHTYKVTVRDNSGAGVAIGPGGATGGLGADAGSAAGAQSLAALKARYPNAIVAPMPGPFGRARTKTVPVRLEQRNPEALEALRAILARHADDLPAAAAAPTASPDEAAWLAWWNRATAAG